MKSDESNHDDHDDSDQDVDPRKSPLPVVDSLDYQDSWLTRDQIMAAETDCHYQCTVQQLQLSSHCMQSTLNCSWPGIAWFHLLQSEQSSFVLSVNSCFMVCFCQPIYFS